MDLYRRLLIFAKPYRGRLAVAVAVTVIVAAATAIYAFLLGPLLKVLLTGSSAVANVPVLRRLPPHSLLKVVALALVATAVIRALAQAVQSYLMLSTGQAMVADIRRALYSRFLELPQAWLGDRHSGDLLSRFGADVQGVEFALTYAFASYVKDSLQVIALLGVCAWLNIWLFMVALAVVPLAAWPLSRFTKGLKKVSVQSQASLGVLSSQLAETVANARAVQAFCREDYVTDRFDKAQSDYLSLMRKSFALRAGYSPLVEMLGVLGVAATLYFATTAIAQGRLSSETLFSFLGALMFMYQPVKSLASTGQNMVQSMAGARRIFEVLDADAKIEEPAQPLPAVFSKQLEFRQVDFAYGQELVLKGVDLTVERGRTLAMVGQSGSGKSTIGSLLLRFWDPTSGTIQVDGRDIRAMRLADWRRMIAFVPQEPVLFSGTVRENVGCVKENATDQEIAAALQAAHAWEFVCQMEGGLNAVVGERGAGLSGGQRQRIALARALLTQAPIILLDEATSSLDSASEALVQKGLEALLNNRTALIIAHRLRTVEKADEIVVLSQGQVIERGSHVELIRKDQAYAALWKAQS